MSTRTWTGNAAAVAQATAYVLAGTWEANDVIIFTIGTKSVSMVTGSTVAATIAASMVTTWNALASSEYPEFAEITASANSATFTLTGDTKGKPFTCTISTTETGGGGADAQTIDGGASSTGTDSTACSGPNFFNVAANWAENAVPVNSDDVVFDRGSVDCLYGLDNNAVTLATLKITSQFTGKIGLPTRNANGYEEYRDTFLKISSTVVAIGLTTGTGSGRIKLNVGTVQTAVAVYNTGTPAETGLPSFCFKGTHASNTFAIYNGSAGAAMFSGETATIATLSQTGGNMICGLGVTLTTINKSGGTLLTGSAATTVTNIGGDITLRNGAHTTINLNEGTLNYESTGTITTLNVYAGGRANFANVNSARTVTNCTVTEGGAINDPAKTVTWTNGIDLYQTSIQATSINIGEHFTLTPTAI